MTCHADDLEESASPEESQGPEHRRFTVRRDVRLRLDTYLQRRLSGVSRSRVQKLIQLGGVMVNDAAPKASAQIHAGDVIDVVLPPRAIRKILPEPIPLHILFEDDQLIIINKQADLIVHPARSHLSGTLLNGLAYRYQQKQLEAGLAWSPHQTRGFRATDEAKTDAKSGEVPGLSGVGVEGFRPGIVHRLDRFTTGVLLVAKTDEAHWGVARQFEDRSTLKAYLAVAHGNFDTPSGIIEQPIGKHPTIREAQAVRHDSSGKHALTYFRVREQYDGFSLIELELKTGRTHQIRVHLSYLGHPIVGDILYGGEPVGPEEFEHPPVAAGSRAYLNFARTKDEGRRIEARAKARDEPVVMHPALHAAFLRVKHPGSGELVTFTAPVHDKLRQFVRALRRRPAEDRPVAKTGTWVDLGAAIPTAPDVPG